MNTNNDAKTFLDDMETIVDMIMHAKTPPKHLKWRKVSMEVISLKINHCDEMAGLETNNGVNEIKTSDDEHQPHLMMINA